MGYVYDDLDRSNVREQLKVSFLFFFGHKERIDGQLLLRPQGLKDFTRRDSSQGVKARFGKSNSMARCHRLPGAPMQGHGISEGAVAIKNNAANHPCIGSN